MNRKNNPELIVYQRCGKWYARRRPSSVSNPRTAAQQANRKRFAKRYASHTPPAQLRDTSQSTPMPSPATHAEDDEHPTRRNQGV